MLWRHLCLVRAITAAGLLTFSTLGALAAGEPQEPIPGSDAQAETVKVLDAEKAGTLAVEVRGQGQDRVKVSLKNTSGKRLNVVLPPGLVASSSVGQGGGAGGGGGFQNMGLGAATNRSGGFGQFTGNSSGQTGFRSVPTTETSAKPGVIVPAGQTVDLEIPAVCLNFGIPTPTPRNKFKLVDVDDYSRDVRVRKALRTLATLGTSHGTAQAIMWRICNDVPFEMMVEQGEKVVNPAEVALASRFLEALEQSGDSLDPAYLSEARLFVTVEGEGLLAKDAKRLGASLEGLRVLGLPVRLTPSGEAPRTQSPALHLGITLTSSQSGETRGRVVVQAAGGMGQSSDWSNLGQVSFKETSAASSLDGASLARALGHAVGSGFVSAKVAKRTTGSTTFKIENRLPFTLTNVTLKTGASAGSPLVTLSGLGVGPGRTGLAVVPAASGSIDQVELNGL